MNVVFLVCDRNLNYPISELKLTLILSVSAFTLFWLDWGGTKWKPKPLQSAVMCQLAQGFTGSDG